jgi:hypothetical protein
MLGTLVQEFSRIRVYNALVLLMILYGSEFGSSEKRIRN